MSIRVSILFELFIFCIVVFSNCGILSFAAIAFLEHCSIYSYLQMESNIYVLHSKESHMMAFHGNEKPERWSRIMNLVKSIVVCLSC